MGIEKIDSMLDPDDDEGAFVSDPSRPSVRDGADGEDVDEASAQLREPDREPDLDPSPPPAQKLRRASRRVLWIYQSLDAVQKARARQLKKQAYDVQFIKATFNINNDIAGKRFVAVVICDSGDRNLNLHVIQVVSSRPDMAGTRMVLLLHQRDPKIMQAAVSQGFRALLPLDITEQMWLTRFENAVAGRQDIMPRHVCAVTMEDKVRLYMPARVVWIYGQRLRIETSAHFQPGANIVLSGDIANLVGTGILKATVVESENSRLKYRFSNALVCTWQPDQTSQAKAREAIERLKTERHTPEYRVFAVARTQQIKDMAALSFRQKKTDLRFALTLKSLDYEPGFFTPDAIIIEAELVTDSTAGHFRRLAENVDPHVRVVLLGENAIMTSIWQRFPDKTLIQVESVDAASLRRVAAEVCTGLPLHCDNPEASYIEPHSPLSPAEVLVPGSIESLYPASATICTPVKITRYATFRVDVPMLRKILGRLPYVKAVDCYNDQRATPGTSRFVLDCVLSDMSVDEQVPIALAIKQLVANEMDQFMLSLKYLSGTLKNEVEGPQAQRPRQSDEMILEKYRVPEKEPKARPIVNWLTSQIDIGVDNIFGIIRSHGFRLVMIWCGVTILVAGLLTVVVTLVAPTWNRSGDQYTDSLKKFAPQRARGRGAEEGGE